MIQHRRILVVGVPLAAGISLLYLVYRFFKKEQDPPAEDHPSKVATTQEKTIAHNSGTVQPEEGEYSPALSPQPQGSTSDASNCTVETTTEKTSIAQVGEGELITVENVVHCDAAAVPPRHSGDGHEETNFDSNVSSPSASNSNSGMGKQNNNRGTICASGGEGQKTLSSNGFTTLNMVVPCERVGALIGRQGCIIKALQAETKTRVDLEKEAKGVSSYERKVTIRGKEKDVQEAEMRILHIIYSQVVQQTHTIEVPQACVGRIIGASGSTIKRIQSDSDCRVKVNADRSAPNAKGIITFTGTDQSIVAAMAMIEEIVQEFEVQRSKLAISKTNARQPSRHDNSHYRATGGSSVVQFNQWPHHHDYVEVYVSASENPSHIWVQIITTQAYKMEEMRTEMSNYYNNYVDTRNYVPTVGEFVAAQSPHDGVWYRGYVVLQSDSAYDIYFIDYGDNEYLQPSAIRPLMPMFCGIPAQAIECLTVAVEYKDIVEWTDTNADTFDSLTYTGQWVVLQAKAEKWITRESDGKQLPVLRLIDTNAEKDVDIIKVLCDEILADQPGDKEPVLSSSIVVVESDTSSSIQESIPVITISDDEENTVSTTQPPLVDLTQE